MNTQEIQRLLEKYYEGNSTEKEEAVLKKYFSETENIPEDLKPEKEIFKYYHEYKSIPMPSDDFENRIINSLDDVDKDSIIPWYRKRLYAISGVAAACLLLVGSYFFFIHRNEPRDTFSNPEIAYAETIKILYDVSEKMNSGVKALEPFNKIENTATRSIETLTRSTGMIGNNLKNIEYFQKALKVVYSPFDINTNK
jgi:hypothetical protein